MANKLENKVLQIYNYYSWKGFPQLIQSKGPGIQQDVLSKAGVQNKHTNGRRRDEGSGDHSGLCSCIPLWWTLDREELMKHIFLDASFVCILIKIWTAPVLLSRRKKGQQLLAGYKWSISLPNGWIASFNLSYSSSLAVQNSNHTRLAGYFECSWHSWT